MGFVIGALVVVALVAILDISLRGIISILLPSLII